MQRPVNGSDASFEVSRVAAFRTVKPICVSLLPRAPLSAATARETCQKLSDLQQALRLLTDGTIPYDYCFFPLAQLLRINSIDVLSRHQAVLERCMQIIAELVGPWRNAVPAMHDDLATQIWLVCALVLGGPLESSREASRGKSKQVQWGDETLCAVLKALESLLKPAGPNQVLTSLRPADYNHPQRLQSVCMSPLPVLAHTLTALLDHVQETGDRQTRQTALSCLDLLIKHQLDTAGREGATLRVQFFPGVVSALTRMLSSHTVPARTLSSEEAAACITLLQIIIEAVFSDRACADVLAMEPRNGHFIGRLEEFRESQLPSTSADTKSGLRSIAWLRATSGQLHAAFTTFAPPLRDHHSPSVRQAYVGLLKCLAVDCSRTADQRTRRMSFADLLALATDEYLEVAIAATTSVTSADDSGQLVTEILVEVLKGLPQVIMSVGDADAKMSRASALISGSARALVELDSMQSIHQLARVDTRWSNTLLYALELATVPTRSHAAKQSETAQAWTAPARTVLQLEHPAGQERGQGHWPLLPLKRIPADRSVRLLRQAFVELGRIAVHAPKRDSLLLVQKYLALTFDGFTGRQRASAWWMLDALLEAMISSDQTRLSANHARFVRSVVQRVLELSNDDLQKEIVSDLDGGLDTEKDLLAVEHRRGIGESLERLASFAGDGNPPRSTETFDIAAESTRLVTLCLSLRCLSTAAAVLTTAFVEELRSTLYLVLAYMGSASHPLLQSHAQEALSRIATACGYASTQNLVLDNVDYIINSVSQHLRLPRLDPQAPLVLVTIVRLVGKDIVPLVQDVIEDVFDALDDFHEYQTFCASLIAVLDALMKAMADDSSTSDESLAYEVDSGRQEQPKPEAELASFRIWLEKRSRPDDRPRRDVGPPPQGSWAEAALDDMDKPPESDTVAEEAEPAPSRAQSVCMSMLSKSLLFLSHDSSFLRARVLSLMASAVPILASRRGDLLPIIHKAWPFVLNRLSDAEHVSVIAEAAALVEALGRHVGEFMTRKVLDEAWPRFKALLVSMANREEDSALPTRFSSVERTRSSIVLTMTSVCRSVPLRSEMAWELAMSLRIFLRASSEAGLQQSAKQLFVDLRAWHPEVVWLILMGSLGNNDIPSYMRMESINVDLVQSILEL